MDMNESINIKRMRKSRGMTQEQVGILAGMSKSQISRMESGKLGSPATYARVLDALGYKAVVHYEDDCAFAVRGTYEIFAFDKDDKGFGFVNYHSSKQKYYASDASVDNKSIYNLYSVYQKTANKTFYLLDLGTDKYQEELFECDDLDFEYFAKINAGISSMNQVYAVNTSKPIQKILVRYDDRQKTFTTNRGLYITGTH